MSFRIFVALCLAAAVARAEIIDAIAAVVNGEIITLSELRERIGPGFPAGPSAEATKRREQLLRRAADDAIADKLLEKEAETQGILPTEADLDNAIEDVKRSNSIDDATLDQALMQQGMSRKKYRDMLRVQLTRMKVVEFKVKPRVTVAEDDIKLRYAKMTGDVKSRTEAHARDIYLPSGGDAAGTRAKVEAAKARILKGESFEAVARDVGGPLASAGGDLGWITPGTMLPEIEKAAFALKKGQLSEVFEGGGGYHLVTVEETRTSGGAKPLTEAREELRQQILSERLQKATEEYLNELRKTADVELRLP